MSVGEPKLRKDFSVFDCDAHINDPLAIWGEVRRAPGSGASSAVILGHCGKRPPEWPHQGERWP